VQTKTLRSSNQNIQAGGSDTEKVDEFSYLGSYVSFNSSCEKDVNMRIGKAAAVFSKMEKIWRKNNISLKVKTRLYEAIILSTLLYGAEVWPLRVTLTKRLDAAQHRWQWNVGMELIPNTNG